MTSVPEKLARLEMRLDALEKSNMELKEKVTYYDRLALRWGGIIIGAVTLGAIITMGFDKFRDKVLTWFTH